MSVEVGQVWKDLDRRAKNRTITVQAIIDDGARVEAVITDGEGNTGRTIRIQVSRLNPKGHWRLLKQADGSVPETGLDDAFAAVNDREGDQLNQLVLFGNQEFIVDSVGLSKHGTLTMAGSAGALEKLLKIHSATPMWIGDMANAIKGAFGEEAHDILDHSLFERYGLSESTMKTYEWVASRVPDENRRVAQSFGHMQAVAALRPDQQRKFLEESREGDWAVSKLKVEIALRTEDGKTKLRFMLIVDAGTEAKQQKLAVDLETQGFGVTQRTGKKRDAKPKKVKKAKKEVTAKSKGKGKMSANRRRPA